MPYRSQHYTDWYHLYVLVLAISILISLIFGVGAGYQGMHLTEAKKAREIATINEISHIVEKHLWLYDFTTIESISLLLLQNDYIQSLKIVDNNGLVLFTGMKETQGVNLEDYRYTFKSQTDETLKLGVLTATLIVTSKQQIILNAISDVIIFFVCFFIPFILIVHAYTNHFIAKPLDKLSAAIDQTIDSGEPAKTNITDTTRFGRFAKQFNVMQGKLEEVQQGLAHSMENLQLQTELAEGQSRLLDDVMRGVGQTVTYFDQNKNVIRNDIGDDNFSVFKTIPTNHYSSIQELQELFEDTQYEVQIIRDNPVQNETNILYELELVSADQLSINVKGLALDGGGLAIVSTDITKAKEQEVHLRQAQKLEAIGLLTSGVAHDLNNFLAIITNTFSILDLQSNIHPEMDDELKTIITSGQETTLQATKVVSSLLTFSRTKPHQFKEVSPHDIVNNLNSIITTSSLGLDISLTQTVLTHKKVSVDEDTLNTSLLNLIFNARDAINENKDRRSGEITLIIEETSLQTQRKYLLSPRKEGYLSISVKDTGMGIPQENIEKILNPFFTTKNIGEGTGLGLSMVYGFADQLGGTLGFENNTDYGAKFTLILPIRSIYMGTDIEIPNENVALISL